MGAILVSGLVLLTAWRSMLDSGERLWQYQFEWPTLTAASEASALRTLTGILILAFFIWLVFGVLGSWAEAPPRRSLRGNPATSAVVSLAHVRPAGLTQLHFSYWFEGGFKSRRSLGYVAWDRWHSKPTQMLSPTDSRFTTQPKK